MSKTYKILHLYHDLMNLYGEWGNVDIMARFLGACGFKAAVDKKSINDNISFDEYSFIYIGSGTERSQEACMRDLACHKAALSERIEAGVCMLATGNSHELFGSAVTTAGGERFEALGLLDFETVQRSTRVTGDCVCSSTLFTDKLIGFINRAGGGQVVSGEVIHFSRPFTLLLGPPNEDGSNYEGIAYRNLLGTYLTGPVLVRNPPLLSFLADLITGQSGDFDEALPLFKYQKSTYSTALAELIRIKDLNDGG